MVKKEARFARLGSGAEAEEPAGRFVEDIQPSISSKRCSEGAGRRARARSLAGVGASASTRVRAG
jgi:hypothetical protein